MSETTDKNKKEEFESLKKFFEKLGNKEKFISTERKTFAPNSFYNPNSKYDVIIESLDDFKKLIQNVDASDEFYLFRGHSSHEWKLNSSWYRTFDNIYNHISNSKQNNSNFQQAFQSPAREDNSLPKKDAISKFEEWFKNSKSIKKKSESDLVFLAKLQHSKDATTPLIDFTSVLQYATWFAVDTIQNNKESRAAIFVINASEHKIKTEIDIKNEKKNDIYEPPFDVSNRVIAQKSYFIFDTDFWNVDINVFKISIHMNAISDIRNFLNLNKKINNASIFPGAKGIYLDAMNSGFYEIKDSFTSYNRGIKYFKEDNFEKAIDEFKKAIEKQMNTFNAYIYRGNAYTNLKEWEQALKDYNKAIELEPNFAWAYYNRALVYVNLKEQEQALKDYTKAIDLDPTFARAYSNRGIAYDNLGKPELALENFTKSIELDPTFAPAYANRGNIYLDYSKKPKLALKDHNKAIELDPTFASAYYNRALVYVNLKEREQALKDYTKAIELDPTFASAYSSRGNAYVNLKKPELALEDYNKAIELDPTFASAYSNRGIAYVNLKKPKLALEDYNKAIELDPTFASAYSNRGNAYVNLKKPKLALEDYNKAIELDPTFARAYSNRGNAYVNLKKPKLALEDYNTAIELDPTLARAYSNRGSAYVNLKKAKLALEDYNKALELDPTFAGAYFKRALTYIELINESTDFEKMLNDFSYAIKFGSNGSIKLLSNFIANSNERENFYKYLKHTLNLDNFSSGQYKKINEALILLLKEDSDCVELIEKLKGVIKHHRLLMLVFIDITIKSNFKSKECNDKLNKLIDFRNQSS